MQTVSSKIWTHVAVSISYDNIHYTMNASAFICVHMLNAYMSSISKVGDRSQGQPEGSLFYSYYTEV